MMLGVPDDLMLAIAPSIVYWAYSGVYALLGDMHEYRLHTKEEENTKNIVSKSTVVKGVLLTQALHIGFSLAIFMFKGDSAKDTLPQPSLFVMICQFLTAAVTLDTHHYFVHRFIHTNKFLTKIHSSHHALVVPYSYGALYGHPLDSFILEISGSIVATLVSGMTPRTTMYFFCFGTMKAVDDHCGLLLPGNLFQKLFKNNCAYHSIHHQLYGNKFNFSQPFFITWDKILGTHLPYTIEKREGGGFEVKPIMKEIKDQ